MDFPQLKEKWVRTRIKEKKSGLLLIKGLWQFFNDVISLLFGLKLWLLFDVLHVEHLFNLRLSGSNRLPNNFLEKFTSL